MRLSKVVAAFIVVGVLGSGSAILANSHGMGEGDKKVHMQKGAQGCGDKDMHMQKGAQGCGDKKGKACGDKRAHKKDTTMRELMFGLNALDLTTEQRKEIEKLKIDMKFEKMELCGKKDDKTPFQKALSESGFDKKAFIAAKQEKGVKKAEIKAEFLSKVFKLLSKDQIKELNEHIK